MFQLSMEAPKKNTPNQWLKSAILLSLQILHNQKFRHCSRTQGSGLQLGGSKPLGVAWLAESLTAESLTGWELKLSGTIWHPEWNDLKSGLSWPSRHTTSACGLGPHSMKVGFWRALRGMHLGKPVFGEESEMHGLFWLQTSGISQHITANVSSAFLLPHSIGYKQVPKASLASGGDHSTIFYREK